MEKKCNITIPIAKYHNDILHPCVRYSERKVLGHNWWMIASPWYKRNDKIENPILFYGIPNSEKDKPPTKWVFYKVIRETPECGYNSDPSIVIINGKLFACWREVETPRLKERNYFSGIYISQIFNSEEEDNSDLIVGEKSVFDLTDLSPEFIYNNEHLQLYSIYHKKTNSFIKKGLYKIFRMFGFKRYANKTIGILHRELRCNNDLIYKNCYSIKLHDSHLPWHFDIIEWKNRIIVLLYCEFEPNIYIGEIKDKEIYICNSPITKDLNIKDTYKPTGIIMNDTLWLYYTDKLNPRDPYKNELYCVSYEMNQFFNY